MLTERQKEKLAAAKQQALKTASKTSVLTALEAARQYGVMTDSSTGQWVSKEDANKKTSRTEAKRGALVLQSLDDFEKQKKYLKNTATNFNTTWFNSPTILTDSLRAGQNLDIKRQRETTSKKSESSFFTDLQSNKPQGSYTSRANSARGNLEYFQNQLEELDKRAQQAGNILKHSFGRGQQIRMAEYNAEMQKLQREYEKYSRNYNEELAKYKRLVRNAGSEANKYKNQIDYLQELNTELQVQLAEQIELSKLGTDTTEQMRAIKQQQKINYAEMQRLNSMSNSAKSYYYVGKTLSNDYDKNSAYDDKINDSFYKYINGDEEQFNKATARVMSGVQSGDDIYSYRYMEPEEIQLYNYIYKTEGKDNANEYLDFIKNTLAQRMGQETYDTMGAAEKALYFIPAGLNQWATGIANFSRMIAGKDPQTSATQEASGHVRQEAYDKNKLLGIGYDLGTTVVNNIPNQVIGMGAGALLSGTNMSLMAANLLQKTASGAGIFTSSAGNYYNEALQSGLTMSQARTYAVLSGLSEASLESAIGGISQIGGFAPENLIRLTDGISNAILRGAVQIGISGSSEAVEEGLQSILSPVLKNLITHTDSEEIDWADVGYSAMLGFLSSLPSSAAHIAANGTRPTGFNTEQFNDYLASDGTDYFDGCDSLQEVQQRYKQLAKENHPDVGGDASVMADVNKQYTIRKAYYSTYEKAAKKYGTENTPEPAEQQTFELTGNIESADQNINTQQAIASATENTNNINTEIDNINTDVNVATDSDSTQQAQYSIDRTKDNKPFVKVDRDILAGVPKSEWASTVKENLKSKFPNGITVGRNSIAIDNQSRKEMTFSGYMKWLYRKDIQTGADKLRSTDNADEIVKAATDWVSEGLNHPRKDTIMDFARGNVLIRVGDNDYNAEVIVGTQQNGKMKLYDIINLQPTKIETNTGKAANPSPEAHRTPVLISDNNIPQVSQQVNNGVDITSAAGDNITTNQAQQIQGGTDNVRDYVYNRNRGRNAATYTSQQTGRMGEGTVRAQRSAADAGRTAIKRTAAARDLRLERVSGKDYGISQATENKTFSVLPESAYDDELNTVSKEIYDKTGKQAVFTIGSIEIQTQNGVKAVRGVSTNEYILVQANNPRATATQLGQHEIYHELARQNPGLNEKVMQAITQEHSQQEVDAQIGRYIEHYRGVYDADNPEEGLVFADVEAMRQQEVYDMLKEEFLADAYAGLNSYGAKASRYTDQARSATQEYVPANSPSNQSQGVQQTRGPDETYSVENKEGGKDDERRKMDNSGLRRRFYMENTGERIAKSTGSGGISEKRGKEDKLSIYTGTGRRNVYAEDSEGRGVSREQVRQLEGTTVVDDEGRIKAVYHFTPGLEFTEFREGDIGFHFGTKQQAEKRAKDKGSKTGRMFRVYLDIKNPINVRLDIGSWKPQHLGLYLSSEGYITEEQFEQIYDLEGNTYNSPAAQKLREILREKGYDGIEYPNGFEGKGKSYIAFWDDQIIRTDIYNVDINSLPGDQRFSLDDTPPWEQARREWEAEHAEKYDTTAPGYIDNVSDEGIQAAMRAAGVKTLEEYSNWLEAREDNTAQIKEIENELKTATEQQFAAKPNLSQRMIDSYEKTGRGIKLKQGGMESDQPGRYVGLSDENEDLLEGLHRDMRQLGIEDFDKYLEYRAKQIDEEFMRPKGREEFKGTPAMKKYGIKIAGAAGDYSKADQIRQELKAQKAMTENVRRVERQIKPTEGEKAFARGLVDGIYDIEAPIPGNLEAWKVEEMLEAYWNEAQFDLSLLPNQRKKLNSVYDSMAQQLLINSNEHSSGLSAKLMLRTPQRNNETVFGVEDGRRINELIFDPVGENEAESIRWEESIIDRVRKLKDSKGKTRELTKDESAITQLYMEGIMDEDFQQLIDNHPKSQAIKEAASKLDKAPKRGKKYSDFRSSLATEYNLNSTELTLAERYQKRNWAQRLIKNRKADAQIAQTAADKYRQLYDDFYDIINDFLVIHGYDEIGFRKNYAPHMQDERTKQTMTTAMQAIGLNMDVNNLPTEIAGKTMNNKPNKRWNPFFQKRTGERTQFDAEAGLQNYIEFMSDIIFHTDDIMKVRALSRELRGKYSQQNISDLVQWANQAKYGSREDKLNFLSANGKIQSGTVLSETEIDNAINKMYEDAIKDAENITNYGSYANWLDEYANQLAGKQSILDRSIEAFAGRKILNAANFFTRLFGKSQIAGNISSALNQTAQLPYIVNDIGAKWTAQALKDIATRKVTRDDWYKRSDFLMGKMGYKELAESVPEKVLSAMFKPAEMVDMLMSGIAVRGEYLKQINNGKSPEQAMRLADQKGRQLIGSRLKGEKPTAFNSKNPIVRMALMFSVEAVNNWDYAVHDIPNDIKQYAKENGKTKAAVYWSLKIMSLLAMAFAVNRLAEELYGGTPVPFDVYGMAATTLASGYGLDTNKYLATVFDDIMQELGGDRFFNTEPIEDKTFDWQAGAEDLLYNLGNDIPLVRNALALAGVGDNTLPLPDFSKILDIVPVAKDEESSWTDILNAFVQAAGEFIPGGRQLTKTASGIMDQINNGITYGYGDNERLRSPGATTWQEVVQEMIFGTNALSQSREYWASGGTTLSAKQTALYQRLVEDGADEWSIYNAINDYRAIEADEELNIYERGAQQREIINMLDISDEQKFDMLKTLEGWKDDQATTKAIQGLLDSNISWNDIMTVYDQVKLNDYDKSVAAENNQQLTGDEIDNRLRDTISKLNINEADKVKIYTSFTDKDSNVEKFPAMYDTGLSFEQMSEIYGEYSRLSAQLDADESLSASDQATAFLYWLDLQDLTSEQLKTVTDNYKFWNIFPAQAGKYEKYTDAGISADSAMNLTQALEQAEEENGEETLSNNEKYRIVVDNNLEGEERYIALRETIAYDTTQAKISIMYEDYGIDVSNWVIMQEWKEANNVSQYWSQSSAIEALNAMPYLTTAEKAVMWQLCNSGWDPDSNPYSRAIGYEVYYNYKERTKEAND